VWTTGSAKCDYSMQFTGKSADTLVIWHMSLDTAIQNTRLRCQ